MITISLSCRSDGNGLITISLSNRYHDNAHRYHVNAHRCHDNNGSAGFGRAGAAVAVIRTKGTVVIIPTR